MDTESRLGLIKKVGEEIITEEELKTLLETKAHPIAYDGFEPSGRMHIAQGILRAINVNKMIKAGCHFIMLAADWHAWANNKLGGDLEKIQTSGDYFVELWKASGMDIDKVKFVRSSDLLSKDTYWKTTMQIARNTTVKRIVRCAQIMGRSEDESLQASQIFYPCMQAADIFELKVDIAQLGMDQRKVNMLAREIGEKLGFWKPIAVHHHMLSSLSGPEKIGTESKEISSGEEVEVLGNYILQLNDVDDPSVRIKKIYGPMTIHRRMAEQLYGVQEIEDKSVASFTLKDLKQRVIEKDIILIKGKSITTKTGIAIKCLDIDRVTIDKVTVMVSPGKLQLTQAVKMSKSKPDTAIFMDDREADIKRKITKAYCPEKIVEENPVLEYAKYLVFEKFKTLRIERPAKFGGDLEIENYDELVKIYREGQLHPQDLKNAVAVYINNLVEPVRNHFEKNAKAKKLLEEIKSFEVTR